MSKPGPKPLPQNVIKLQGGSQTTHRPLPETVKTKTEAPVCPEFIRTNARAKKHWDYIVRELKKYELISKLDQAALVGYASSYAHFQFAEEMIGIETKFDEEGNVVESGLVQVTPQNYKQVSAWWVIRNKALEQLIKIGDLFGLSPSGRVRVSSPNPNQGELEL